MSDIRQVLELIRQRLDETLRNTVPRAEEWVVLSNLVDVEGRPYDGAKDKVVMFLANVQHETVISTYSRTVPAKDADGYVAVAPPLYIDLFVLFLANFQDRNYPEGLATISRVISFFQQNPWFTSDSLPGLPVAVGKLTFEFTNLEMTELNYLMGLCGAKYLPSAYYKVRMLPFTSDAMQAVVPGVKGLRTPGEPDLGAPPPPAPARPEQPAPRARERRR